MEISLEFFPELLNWYGQAKRDLPWRNDRDPYHIWLSEIMCQQTRIEAVKNYYSRFTAALPDIPALAACSQERLDKLWEGLGYYSRVRNMKRAAEQIVERYQGAFPTEYDAVLALPGIGDYTAAAICSICYDLPYPAVDGNVLRVMTRFLAYGQDISLPQTKREIRECLLPMFQKGSCGDLNQALMELGALICIPNGTPDCCCCPLSAGCRSRSNELWRVYPVKKAKPPRKVILMTVFILRCGEYYAIHKRGDVGLLAGLWEFPSISRELSAQEVLRQVNLWNCSPIELLRQINKRHIFTHVEWDMHGYYLECNNASELFIWDTAEKIRQYYSLPTAYRQFFDDI